MCSDRVGQHRLGASGAPRLVVGVLLRFEKAETVLLSASGCALIASLSLRSLDNQNRLAAAGAFKVVISCLDRGVSCLDQLLVLEALSLDGKDTYSSGPGSTRVRRTSYLQTVGVKLGEFASAAGNSNMKIFTSAASMSLSAASGQLNPLAESSSAERERERNKERDRERESDAVISSSSSSLLSVSASSSAMAAAVFTNNALLGTTLSALNLLVTEACRALANLARDNEANRLKLAGTAGLVDVLTKILSSVSQSGEESRTQSKCALDAIVG